MASYELEYLPPTEEGDVEYIGLSGELDLMNASELVERLSELAQGDSPLVIDLTRVVFIDSAAIHGLFQIARERGPHSLAFVVEPAAPVAATLGIVELHKAATVVASLADAKAVLSGSPQPG